MTIVFRVLFNEEVIVKTPDTGHLLGLYDQLGSYSEGTVPVRKGDKEFHVNLEGIPVYSQHYDEVAPFSEKLATTRGAGQWFHIHPDGIPAYTERYDEVCDFLCGRASVKKNGQWFHILPDGTPAYIERYDDVRDFHVTARGIFACIIDKGVHFHIRPDGKRVEEQSC